MKDQIELFANLARTTTDDLYKGWYNGFSMEQRRAANPLLREAQLRGALAIPTECTLCNAEKTCDKNLRIDWHLEDYRDYLNPYSLCWRCHRAVHSRFNRPTVWYSFVKKLPENSWAGLLSIDPMSKQLPFNVTYPNGLPRAKF